MNPAALASPSQPALASPPLAFEESSGNFAIRHIGKKLFWKRCTDDCSPEANALSGGRGRGIIIVMGEWLNETVLNRPQSEHEHVYALAPSENQIKEFRQ